MSVSYWTIDRLADRLVEALDRLTEAIKDNQPMNIVINTTSTDPEALAKRIHEGIQNANEHRK